MITSESEVVKGDKIRASKGWLLHIKHRNMKLFLQLKS